MNPQDEALSMTEEDREWADKVIAVEHPNNHEAYEYAVAEVIAAHRLSHSTPGVETHHRATRAYLSPSSGEPEIELIAKFRNLSALSKPTPVEAGVLAIKIVANELARMPDAEKRSVYGQGAYDAVHRVLRRLLAPNGEAIEVPHAQADAILAALSETQPPRETSTETKESGE